MEDIFGLRARMNSLKATRWEMLKARLFGIRVVGIDVTPFGRTEVAAYKYKGKYYLVDFK